MKTRDALLIVAGVIVLGVFLIIGPFGVPGDIAGLGLISAGGGKALSHGK